MPLKKSLHSPSGHGLAPKGDKSEGEYKAVIFSLGKSTAPFCAVARAFLILSHFITKTKNSQLFGNLLARNNPLLLAQILIRKQFCK